MNYSYRSFGKRIVDLVVALALVVALLPLLMVLAFLVRLDSPGAILYVQERLGYRGKLFRLYKFRTMVDRPRATHSEVGLEERHPEVTRVGHWLRRFKLDELPQLLNVVRGDMALVGPRPALPNQLKEYDEIAAKRLLVRPGLTGLAQIHGNIHLTWPERWQYDARYAENVSLALDVEIALRTLAVIVRGEKRYLQRPGELRTEWEERVE